MAQCGNCRFFGLLEDGNEDMRGKCIMFEEKNIITEVK